jgi:hypothetical protein
MKDWIATAPAMLVNINGYEMKDMAQLFVFDSVEHPDNIVLSMLYPSCGIGSERICESLMWLTKEQTKQLRDALSKLIGGQDNRTDQ